LIFRSSYVILFPSKISKQEGFSHAARQSSLSNIQARGRCGFEAAGGAAGGVSKSPPPPPIARLAIGDFKTKGRKIHYDSSSLVRLHQRSVEGELKVSKIYQNEGEPGGDASS
jgi:hypothetical protein